MQVQKPKQGYKIVQDFFKRNFEIPEEWMYPKFLQVVKVNPPTKIAEKKVPYLPMDAIDVEKPHFNYYEERNLNDFSSLPKFQENDVLFASITPSTENGKTCIIENFSRKGIGSSELTVLRPTEKIVPRYLYYYIKSNRIRQFAISQMMGTTGRQRVPDYVFKKDLSFELPTIPEQQKISSILSHIDDLINKYDSIINSTKMLKRGLMQQFLTKGISHTKFKKIKWYFGKEIEFPSEWDIVKLKDVCMQITDGVHETPEYQEKGIPFLSVNNIENEKIDFSNCKYISLEAHKELIKRCHPEKGDVLLSKVGTLGIADEIDFDREFSIFVQLALLKPNKTKIDSTFLKNTLNFTRIRNRIQACAAGTTLQYIGIGSIGNLFILLPTLQEQQKIASLISKTDLRSKDLESIKSHFKSLKKGLMQKLLTGSLKV